MIFQLVESYDHFFFDILNECPNTIYKIMKNIQYSEFTMSVLINNHKLI